MGSRGGRGAHDDPGVPIVKIIGGVVIGLGIGALIYKLLFGESSRSSYTKPAKADHQEEEVKPVKRSAPAGWPCPPRKRDPCAGRNGDCYH